jgi:ADP-ribose pyrophosphatase YjhB (NUDIX family)/GNAT superfamily N-acetyltransferase
MKKCDCELCKFENPKISVTAVIIKDQKLLVAKRNEEPFKGELDLFGGYLSKGESPEEGLKREIKEELGVGCKLTLLDHFPGTAQYHDYEFPIVSICYLAELEGEPKVQTDEVSEMLWVPIKEIKTVAFDSNQDILKLIKEKFTFDLDKVKELVRQLDSSAVVNEQSLYKAMFNGYVSKIEENGKLLGMGWIFPRQTLLRRQAVVEDMIVDESQRGKGLGEKILRDLIDWAKKEGVEVVELTTNPKRIAANALYQKVGFKIHPTNHYLLNLK